MKKFIIHSVLLLSVATVSAQKMQSTEFENFINTKNEAMLAAYEKRDTALYNMLLERFLSTYDEQENSLQNHYKNYLQNFFYNQACMFALANEKNKALQSLHIAITKGYNNYTHLLKDKDFEAMRQDSGFLNLANTIRNTGDYLYILQKAGTYDTTGREDLPLFTYQSKDDKALRALSKTFNLDSIAGNGSDVLQVINLMHWIHTLIQHDGNHPNPKVKNAESMLKECVMEKRGLNCRGLAIALNECYLAMGYKSRYVTCLPKDSLQTDPDCHVINVVFIPSLQKWIWMDPTNDAYVMDNKGGLLGIEEVREALRTGKPLILNPNANWNNQFSKTKEDYLYNYMAKNLYMLQCITHSCYDAETERKGGLYEYITLVPPDYFDRQQVKESTNNSIDCTYRFYQTTNAQSFWANPQ